ncbi:MAG: hypothetical protein MJA83_05520, partial [Gammaproteobacteria bacterium]|nr:hypothetical protein [Gammaproteobacteria bacterium]
DLWEWAQVFFVDADVMTGGNVDPLKLTQLVNWKMSLYQGGGPLFTPVGRGMFCTERSSTNVASSESVTIVEDVDLTADAGAEILPAGVCVFLFGRSDTLRRQTRKWVPGIRADLWLPSENYYDTGETQLGVDFVAWAQTLLSPANVGTVGQITDVVWDEANEVMRPLISVQLEKYPRTRGSRQLTGKTEVTEVWP